MYTEYSVWCDETHSSLTQPRKTALAHSSAANKTEEEMKCHTIKIKPAIKQVLM